jgi:chemotaxis protein methyltransferase CheR
MTAPMTDEEFDLLRRILEKAAGLVHDASRRDSLAFAVAGRMEATRTTTVSGYLGMLAGDAGAAERQHLIDVVTIQETHFFRNPPQIRALRQHVLPELVRRAVTSDRPMTIWSAGCSTGEEPYSVAMMIRELMPMATRDHVRILGTDVSASALAQAATAQYGRRAVQMAEPVDLARWFSVDGDSYRVRDDVRSLVEFRLHNLITEAPPFEPGEVDLLLCRNVTIYFNRDSTKALMDRFHTSLSDGGYLFLGHSETLWQMSDAFTLVPLGDAFVYRRDDSNDRRATLPDRRTEPGDPPILLSERRAAADRRRLGDDGPAGPSIALPSGTALPPNWPPVSGPPAHPLPGPGARPVVPEPRSTQRPAPGSMKRPAPGPTQDGRPFGMPERRRRPASGHQADPPMPAAEPAGTDAAAPGAPDPIATARGALAAGRYEDVIVAAMIAARQNPMSVDAHLLCGEALVNLGRDLDAVVELRQAVYLRADCAPAHLLLAGALNRLDEPAAAGRAYRAAAATVGTMPADKVAAFFGGRGADELVELCIRLAMQAERAARMKGRGRR